MRSLIFIRIRLASYYNIRVVISLFVCKTTKATNSSKSGVGTRNSSGYDTRVYVQNEPSDYRWYARAKLMYVLVPSTASPSGGVIGAYTSYNVGDEFYF